MSELSNMSELAFEAITRRIDEMPSRGRGGFIVGVKPLGEFRSRMPTLSKGPKPLEYRSRKRRRSTAELAMQLDEMAVRMQAEDRKLRELGLL
jgi:hypothetical protein